ncbi:sigma-54 interaction domain-containing protein [Desulforhopalus singaporensis]|uniref:HTH-type transcriptional regulatory protein TyrR n=1 Tax=Desulforhopalus singaporensis TaxID=91360 RepID=A0A1H0RYT7_9BACT|nr:sigma 54-interacting transcriptional regulator [Desulforhopalus singaporensis]SDP34547.1 PAS domain S-box-containing protein [Desulforhopalus singaporensis]
MIRNESNPEESFIGFLQVDRLGIIQYASPQAEYLLDCRVDKADVSLMTVAPNIGRQVLLCMEQELHSNAFVAREKERDIEVLVSTMMHDSLPQGALCFLRDIKNAAEAARNLPPIKEMHLQFQALLEHSGYGIYILDGRGIILKVNDVAADLIRLDKDQVIGKSIFKLVDLGIMEEVLTPAILKTKKPLTRPLWAIKSNKYIMASGIPILDEQGEIMFVVVIEHDMTIVKELRAQLNQAKQVAETIRGELSDRNLLELENSEIIAISPAMKQVLTVLLKLTRMDVSNILITGESGAGKGYLAKFVHQHGLRKEQPFISINCATLPEMLLEAELFGYEKGAFTGASETGKAGLFELANNGTIFLDEIGDLPFSVQAKLLKVLDDGEIRRLGGTKSIKVNCIVIAATNLNLEDLVQKKTFRKDLYFRLNTFPVRIPALRDRQEDILAMAKFFLKKFNETYRQKKRFSERCIEEFLAYDFPGNIRELENLIKNAVVIKEKDLLTGILPANRIQSAVSMEAPPQKQAHVFRGLQEDLLEFERKRIEHAMEQFDNTRDLARYFRISQSSVVRKLKKHGLSF